MSEYVAKAKVKSQEAIHREKEALRAQLRERMDRFSDEARDLLRSPTSRSASVADASSPAL